MLGMRERSEAENEMLLIENDAELTALQLQKGKIHEEASLISTQPPRSCSSGKAFLSTYAAVRNCARDSWQKLDPYEIAKFTIIDHVKEK